MNSTTLPRMFVCKSSLRRPEGESEGIFDVYESTMYPGGLWLVGDVKNSADHIFFGYPCETGSKGYAGRWMAFRGPLGDVILQGPWHSNADALYDDTGVDVRGAHYVQLVVGLAWGPDINGARTIESVVYYEDPHYGVFDDYRNVLRRLYSVFRVPLCYWHGGAGGSMSGVYDERNYRRRVRAERTG